ncbi:hypothetical protein ACKLNO_08355 [Neisseriaceae bacterium B1]
MSKAIWIAILGAMSLFWGIVAFNTPLFSLPKYETIAMKSPLSFYTIKGKDKSEMGESVSFYLNGFESLCSGSVDKITQHDICEISQNIQKVEYAEWVTAYFERDGVKVSSSNFLKQMNYLDKNGVAQTFIVADEQIQKNQYARFMSTQGLAIFALIMGYAIVIIGIMKSKWVTYPVMIFVFGAIGWAIYITQIQNGNGAVPSWYLWLIQAA